MNEQCTFVKLGDLDASQTKRILEMSFPKEYKKINLEDLGDISGDILLSITDEVLREEFKIESQQTRSDFLKQMEKYKRNGVPMMGSVVVREEDLTPYNIKSYNQQLIIKLLLAQPDQHSNVMIAKLLPCKLIPSQEAKSEENVKQILIMGETGCGKRALINSVVNVLFKMEQTNQFRFKLIDNDIQTGSSTTKAILGYRLEVEYSSYSYLFWITPGYLNTNGFQYDMETSKSISEFLHSIQRLDAVVVVEKYNELIHKKSTDKAKQLKRYLFNQILSYFGEDVIPYVHLFLTFPSHYEDTQPDLTSYSFPFHTDQVYTINNAVMFERVPANQQLSKLIWDRNVKSIERFIDKLHDKQPLNLKVCTDVILEKTHQLDQKCEMLLDTVCKIRDVEKICEALANKQLVTERTIAANAEYIINKIVMVKHSVATKNSTVYCEDCVFTCDRDTQNNTKYNKVFDRNGYCKICPKKCPRNFHRDHPYIIEEKQTAESIIDSVKKKQFDQAEEEYKLISTELTTRDNEYVTLTRDAWELQKEVQSAVTELSNKAPYFDVVSIYNYLELIKQQKRYREEHCTPFETETYLKHHIVVRVTQQNNKAGAQEKAFEDLTSEVIHLEEEMSVTSFIQ